MRNESPLRTESLDIGKRPLGLQTMEIGWFPYIEARVSLWFKGSHVSDANTWSSVDSAINGAKALAARYKVEPDDPMVVVSTLTDTERVKVWNATYGWQWPLNYFGIPQPILKAQRVAWTSAEGLVSEQDRQEASFRFHRRFAIEGAAAEDLDLAPYFSVGLEAFDDRAMVAGLSHRGMPIRNLSVSNAGPDAKYRNVWWAEATGEVDVLVAPAIWSMSQAARNMKLLDLCQHFDLSGYPTTRHTHWASRASETPAVRWELTYQYR